MMIRRRFLAAMGALPVALGIAARPAAGADTSSTLAHDGMTVEQWMAVRDLEWQLREIASMSPEQADVLFKASFDRFSLYSPHARAERIRETVRDNIKLVRGQYVGHTVFG